uniref:Venom S1 protease 4 n=1 Tax=Ectomocoris sp. TaxID=3104572 RepID=A0AB38ZE55_9HEMI
MWQIEVLLILTIGFSVAIPVEDEIDSSEHGVTPGRVSTNCTCGLSNKSPKRIIGGEESGVNEWPMMAGIILRDHPYVKNVHICGGTVITHRHIITAGHCIHDDRGRPLKAEDIGVILAAHDLKKLDYSDPNVLRAPEKLIKHPNYVWPVTYDLVIVVMPYINFGPTIGPACLPTGSFNVDKKKLKLAGWGYTTPDGPGSDVLKKTDLIGISHKECGLTMKKVRGVVFDTYQVCTNQTNTTQCRGDSGGPIMWVDEDTNRYTLVAAVSYGLEKCIDYPAVSSDISYFLPWIQQTISETYPEEKTCAKVA